MEALPGISHGFLGRVGGVSTGPYASLNLSGRVGDDPASVRRNRELVQKETGRPLCLVKQIHSDLILKIKDPGDYDRSQEEADALVTGLPGIPLAVLTADCLPVLLVDPARRCVAAVHAGLKGTLAGICAKTVERLKTEYASQPSDLYAAVGPGIGSCCYQIEASRLTEKKAFSSCLNRTGDSRKISFDLRKANQTQLEQTGVKKIYHLRYCTSCRSDKFFSYRAGKGVTGRFVSYIMLDE
ncbi:MAG: peptidoglycan editing factor PgeF [bacterium]